MDYSSMAILLGLIALVLVIAEFFIPSGGMISVVAIILGVVSVWSGWKAWGVTHPTRWWIFLAAFVTLIPGTIVAVLTMLPRTRYGRRIFLEPVPASEILGNSEEIQKLDALVGKRGKTATLHTPGGIVEIDGMRYHSESEGLLIEPGTSIEVIAVRGGARLLVREAAGSEPAHEAPPTVSPFLDEEQSERNPRDRLDFQVPEE